MQSYEKEYTKKDIPWINANINTLYELDNYYVRTFIEDWDAWMNAYGLYVPATIYIKHWTCLPPDMALLYNKQTTILYTISGIPLVIKDIKSHRVREGTSVLDVLKLYCQRIDETNKEDLIVFYSNELYLYNQTEIGTNELLSIARSYNINSRIQEKKLKPVVI